MTTRRYECRHYQDVAQILRAEYQRVYDYESLDPERTIDMIRVSFERLFTNDNPAFDLAKFRHAATGD